MKFIPLIAAIMLMVGCTTSKEAVKTDCCSKKTESCCKQKEMCGTDELKNQ